MSDLFWLTNEQIGRLRPFFPKSRGRPREDDRATYLKAHRTASSLRVKKGILVA